MVDLMWVDMISSERKVRLHLSHETFGAVFEDWLGLVCLSHAGVQILSAAGYYVVIK